MEYAASLPLASQLQLEREARQKAEVALAKRIQAHNESTRILKQMTASLVERERKTRAILDAAADGFISVDEHGNIESFNAAAEAIFGHRSVEVIGHNVDLLLALPYPETQARLRAVTHPGKAIGAVVYLGSASGVRKNGALFPMEMSISSIQLGDRQLTIVILRDISERIRVEEELAQAHKRALAASLAKSAFLANMSHELRTPLNAIIGYSEMLQEDFAEKALLEYVPDLKRINSAGQHLLALINDVLDLSQIESGKVNLFMEWCDVPSFIHDVVETIHPLIEKNGNTFAYDCPADIGSVRVDVTKLKQSLLNLLGNSCKFTNQGRITLKVERGQRDGRDLLFFRVSDTGIGMSAEQMDRLFQDFIQADSSTKRKYGGTGLGLAISRRFCLMMEGDIRVSSEVGKGSTFIIELPASDAAKTENPPPTEARPSPAFGCVLVIDDDLEVHDILRRQLEKEGYRVACASSGEEGVRLARALHPTVITLDVMMADLDGWAVLARLKDDPALADIPVVMLTMVNERNLGFSLGVSDYLTKPVERQRLAAVLGKYRTQPSHRPILIVEDDSAIRAMMVRLLQNLGYLVSEAGNGREALVRMLENPPQLILLDLMMPEMDGFQFVEEMRKHDAWRAIPTIVLTAIDLSAEEKGRLNGCVQRVLQKGAVSHEEIVQRIRESIGAAPLRSEHQ